MHQQDEKKDTADFNITLKAHDSEDLNTFIEGHALCSVPINAKTGIVYEDWVSLVESKRWKERFRLSSSKNDTKMREKELRVSVGLWRRLPPLCSRILI